MNRQVTARSHHNINVLFDLRHYCATVVALSCFATKVVQRPTKWQSFFKSHKSGTASYKSGNHFSRATNVAQPSPTKVAIILARAANVVALASALNLVYILKKQESSGIFNGCHHFLCFFHHYLTQKLKPASCRSSG